jgi:4-aminobutyrate aminotransferase
VACAAALATIELLEEGLITNAAQVGKHLKEELLSLKARFPVVSDVRGLGLMIGVELEQQGRIHMPDPQFRDAVVKRCFEKGLLLLACGDSAIRFSPPLIVSLEEARLAVEIFASVLDELAP